MRYLAKILSAIVLIFVFAGCESVQSLSIPSQPQINPSLPQPQEIKAISDLTSIAFEWEPVLNPAVEGYIIYKGELNVDTGELGQLAKIDSRYSSHFVDTGLKPGTDYAYQIATYNQEGQISNKTAFMKYRTTSIEPVSFVSAISNYPKQVKIIWRPHPNQKVNGYRIERNDASTIKWEKISQVNNRLLVEYIDTNLKDDHTYRYRVVATTYSGVDAPPSDTVEAKTKPLPATIESLSATNNLPKKITLNWNALQQKDIVHYKVYRSYFQVGPYFSIGTAEGNFFDDDVNDDGKVFFYKVTGVDKDELEGNKQEYGVMGMTLAKPNRPHFASARIEDGKAVLKWDAGDERAVEYVVYKKTKDWFSKPIRVTGIKGNSFVDNDIIPGIEYSYSIAAIDRFGIESEPTDETQLLLAKSIGE